MWNFLNFMYRMVMFSKHFRYSLIVDEKLHQEKSERCYIEPNLERNYTCPTHLTPNGITFGAKLIGKM